MEEGRVYTHGTLSAVGRRSDLAPEQTAELRGCQVRTTLRRFWNVASGRLSGTYGARRRVSLRVMVARGLLRLAQRGDRAFVKIRGATRLTRTTSRNTVRTRGS